jgi:hypothetical protein
MAKRKAKAFQAGKSQMFAILYPETPQALPQLWSYTTFTCRGDAEAYIKWRCEQFGRTPEEFIIHPCETTIVLSHYPEFANAQTDSATV